MNNHLASIQIIRQWCKRENKANKVWWLFGGTVLVITALVLLVWWLDPSIEDDRYAFITPVVYLLPVIVFSLLFSLPKIYFPVTKSTFSSERVHDSLLELLATSENVSHALKSAIAEKIEKDGSIRFGELFSLIEQIEEGVGSPQQGVGYQKMMQYRSGRHD